jgi:hypothetical protein
MSGMMKTPLSCRIASASGVVGPFAASAMILALTRPALAALIWFSSAAGIRMSHLTSRSLSFEMGSEPGKPATVPCSFFQPMTRSMSRPSRLRIPPPVSLTAITVAPSSRMRRAAMEPALPKPWTATVAFVRSMPRWAAASTIV